MKPSYFRPAPALCALGLIGTAWLSAPAAAHLGGDADSVAVDSTMMRAQLRSTPMQSYQLHEITTASGTQVHEYATPQGTVFALTWQGPLPPNLRQLFGSYYARYQSAAATQTRPGMHRALIIAEPDLVVQSTGHLRAFHGRAYIPNLVPAGVTVADLP